MRRKLRLLLASSVCLALLVSCTALPKGLTPKPDIRPVQQSAAKVQASVGKSREYVSKLKASEAGVTTSLGKVRRALDQSGDSQSVRDAKVSLSQAEAQRKISDQYIQWADTELANAWKYGEDEKQQILTLSGQIDTAHENERVAVAAVEKWKPIIDQVNSYWGLGAFAYGFKLLANHLLILTLVLGAVGVVVFLLFPALLPVALGFFRGLSSGVGKLFRKR